MITCPDCNKTMLERNFRYRHINVCGKPKVPRAKPIEQLVEEKKKHLNQHLNLNLKLNLKAKAVKVST
jgi:ssDNA-binding Zn-finger/Zn-ribbon topoisomerase 1